ncbi:MAG: hypothetical protein COB39_14345 [Marinosulfonomonas sp.]|nr:MAG: hypothetical protein COB39_14345 [Marinosulfonomonas sp.]
MIPENIMMRIRNTAEAEWPSDYVMQAHTIEEQTEAYLKFCNYQENLDAENDIFKASFAKAISEFPDDYVMQVYVFEGQVEAATAFFETIFPDIPAKIQEEIRLKAFSEWPSDYEMGSIRNSVYEA